MWQYALVVFEITSIIGDFFIGMIPTKDRNNDKITKFSFSSTESSARDPGTTSMHCHIKTTPLSHQNHTIFTSKPHHCHAIATPLPDQNLFLPHRNRAIARSKPFLTHQNHAIARSKPFLDSHPAQSRYDLQ